MPLASGTRLGPYEIVMLVGAGGMGEVYRARDTRLDRTVALKILPSHRAQSPEHRERFEREARAISALNDPHICVLHDVGRQDGIDFLVMEYLEGQTLADRLKRGALPFELVLRYGFEIAEALDRAHQQGIVHRDLKPGNVMLTKAGTKLLDFGLARLRPPAPTGESQPTLTGAGGLLGTPRYMAPEQIEGKEPDARTDIFALGAVLYEMATGQQAFPSNAAILSSNPAPASALRPQTPPALDHAVATCLAKDPDDRWQNAHDVAAELRWIAEAGAQAGVPAPASAERRGRERLAWSAAALVSAMLGIALGLTWVRSRLRPEESPRVRFEVRAPEGETFGDWSAAVSPDGGRVAFSVAAEGRRHVYARALDSLTATRIPGTEGGFGPFWSPDGRQIAFPADGKLRWIDLSGGAARVVCDTDTASFLGGSWSEGGTIIFSSRGDLFRVPAGGGEPKPLGRRGEGETRRSWPQFLPGGQQYLYLAQDARPERQGIYVASLDGDDRKRVVASDHNAAYAPSRHLLFVRGGVLLAQPFDVEKRELSGQAFAVAAELALNDFSLQTRAGRASVAAYSVSSNGVLAWRPASTLSTTSLTWFDRAGKTLGTLGEPAGYSNPALSLDDTRLAVDRRDVQTGMRDIWIFDLVRGGGMRLTFDPAEDLGATWSPDGTQIAFTSDRRGHREIYQKLADGSKDEELLVESKGQNASAEHQSSDGRWLVFNNQREGAYDLFVLPLSPGRERKPTPFLATEFREDMGQFSPDSRFLAYRSIESGRSEVYVRSVTTEGTAGPGKWQVSMEGGGDPQWRRDGRELFYVSGPAAQVGGSGLGTLMAVAVKTHGTTFDAGVPKALFEVRLPASRRNRFVVGRDGQRFLVNRINTTVEERIEPIQVLVNWLPSK